MKAMKNVFVLFSFMAAMILMAGSVSAQNTVKNSASPTSTKVTACPHAKTACSATSVAKCSGTGSTASAKHCEPGCQKACCSGSGSASKASAGTESTTTAAPVRKEACKAGNSKCCKAKSEGSASGN